LFDVIVDEKAVVAVRARSCLPTTDIKRRYSLERPVSVVRHFAGFDDDGDNKGVSETLRVTSNW
jgi:hypothetical protein